MRNNFIFWINEISRKERWGIYSWHSSLLVQIWFPCTVIVSVKSESYTEPHFLDYQKKNLILIKKRKKPYLFIYLFIFCLSEISITNHDTMTQISSASSHNFLVKWCTWPLAIKLVHSEETLMMKRITKKSGYMHLSWLKFNTASYPIFFVIYFILRYFKILSYF